MGRRSASYRLKILDEATALMQAERRLLALGVDTDVIRHVNAAKTMLEKQYEDLR